MPPPPPARQPPENPWTSSTLTPPRPHLRSRSPSPVALAQNAPAAAAAAAAATAPSPAPTLLQRNKGVLLVLAAQVFGVLMNATIRVLETPTPDLPPLHPFQILFARMGITLLCSMLYMHLTSTPDFPFGARGVRLLLVLRGVGGFWGVFGMYWSLRYLDLSDATVITFLAPILASWACSRVLGEVFGRVQMVGAGVSLAGVVVIARPGFLFGGSGGDREGVSGRERMVAVAWGMVGVLGASAAYTTIRVIGTRAHPLISVTYFSAWCTLVSTVFLVLPTGVPFMLPQGLWQWGLLIFLGVNGFFMQFLLTAGLRAEKSSRSTMMIYSQMLFALIFDRAVFGITPDVWSLLGGAMILGSAIVVALSKEQSVARAERVATKDEEEGLMSGEPGEVDEEEDEARGRRGAREGDEVGK